MLISEIKRENPLKQGALQKIGAKTGNGVCLFLKTKLTKYFCAVYSI